MAGGSDFGAALTPGLAYCSRPSWQNGRAQGAFFSYFSTPNDHFARRGFVSILAGAVFGFLSAVGFGSCQVSAQSPLLIDTDRLLTGFQDWSWAACDLNNTTPTHSGSNFISVTASVWQSSPDLNSWTAQSTNMLTGSTLNITNVIAPGTPQKYWRAVWQP